ncbi:MAG: ABC transporter permease [Planctomycetota bacterium]
MLSTAWALVRKDIRLFVRDRTALFFALVLPIGLAAIMGTAFGSQMGGGGSSSVKKVTIAVEDRDGSSESEAFVETLMGSDGLRVEVVEDARRLVADGNRAGGLVIPAGYGAAIADGETPPNVTLFRDPARQIASQVMVFQLAPVMVGSMADSMGSGMMGRLLDMVSFPDSGRADAEAAMKTSFDRVEAIVERLEADGAFEEEEPEEDDEDGGFDVMSALPDFIGLEVEDLAPARADGLPRSAGASHAFAAMAVMMLLFNLVAAAGTLQDERAEGTLDRLRLTPAAGRAVLLGKMLVTMILAIVQLVVLFAFGAIAFDVPVLEHLEELSVTSLVWAFCASTLGLLFATACSTRRQMEGLSTLAILGMSAIGGAWFPREITPDWFQTAGLLTPVAWAMDAYHGILWYGKGILATPDRGGVLVPLLVLMAVGVVLFAISARLYSSRYGSK